MCKEKNFETTRIKIQIESINYQHKSQRLLEMLSIIYQWLHLCVSLG